MLHGHLDRTAPLPPAGGETSADYGYRCLVCRAGRPPEPDARLLPPLRHAPPEPPRPLRPRPRSPLARPATAAGGSRRTPAHRHPPRACRAGRARAAAGRPRSAGARPRPCRRAGTPPQPGRTCAEFIRDSGYYREKRLTFITEAPLSRPAGPCLGAPSRAAACAAMSTPSRNGSARGPAAARAHSRRSSARSPTTLLGTTCSEACGCLGRSSRQSATPASRSRRRPSDSAWRSRLTLPRNAGR